MAINASNKKVLSIVIPVYKVEKYIEKCLNSIFSASCNKNDFEVIIINDGTPDNSMTIVNHYAINHENMHVISQSNQGLSRSRNVGIENAKGLYVWFVDSDDWIETEFLSKLIYFLKSSTEDVIMLKIREINEDTGECIKIADFRNENNFEECSGCDMISNWFDFGIDITPIQKFVINRQFILNNNLYFIEGLYHEDKEYAPRMLVQTEKAAYYPEIGYCYLRRSSGSITTDKSLLFKRAISLFRIYDLHLELGKMVDNKKREIIEEFNYTIASQAWYCCALSGNKEWKSVINHKHFIPLFQKDVKKHLFKSPKLTSRIRQLLFLFCPYLLMRMGKGMN